MTSVRPRAPRWAVNSGWPAPEPAESYHAYWTRVGAPEDLIDWSLDVHHKGAEDCGNERMATWLRLHRPGMFLDELDRMAFRAGIPSHRIGVR